MRIDLSAPNPTDSIEVYLLREALAEFEQLGANGNESPVAGQLRRYLKSLRKRKPDASATE
jgi:hypothetical protein